VTCATCGAENSSGQKFCGECGSRLLSGCPSCGAANPPGQRFCGECGTSLGASPASAIGAGPSAAPSPVAERRLVTVLFADLVGFTPFAEEKDAEDVRETLSRYFDISREIVERYGGSVEKFIGDAVMALWGAPVAREDDAERAVRAALELADAVAVLGPKISARVGVLTGEAAVTLGAAGQGMVAGDLVNTAARLQSVASPGTVLVGEATMRAASAAIAFEPAGEQALKGKAAALPAWRALRVVAQRGGSGRADQIEPPFVGRDEEFRSLRDLLNATGRERRTRLVSVTGTAGIGKSRLAWELEKYIDGVVETIYWHRGRSPAYGEGITFWALGEMVRRRAGLAEADDEPTTRAGVAATVGEYISDPSDQAWVEPALLTLLGLEPAPTGGRDKLFAAWRIFFESIAARGTTVLVFEDLHWADGGLLDFIDHLLEWSRNSPILILTLARPELFDRRPDWGAARKNFNAMSLDPLRDEQMRELLAGLVPGLPDAAVHSILARADGIPLYAVETIRMLVAEGRLTRQDDRYEPVGELGALAVPETLRSLIASRLDALEAADRSLLQDASVLGQTFTTTGLAAITGTEPDDIERRLRGMVRRELLELDVDPRSPERGQYRFVQSLIREVAYGTLAKRDRRSRHLAAARFYEALGEDELAAALATHYLAAYEASADGPEADAVAVQARLALRGAADRAASLGAHDQALSYLDQALGVTRDPGEQGSLLDRAATSADAAARYERAIAYAERAVQVHRDAGDSLAAGRSAAQLGEVLIDAGDMSRAIRALEDALRSIDPADVAADEVEAVLQAHLSRALMRTGESLRAVEAADRALPIAERHNLLEVVAEAFINKGSSLSELGRLREAAAIMEAAVQLAETVGRTSTELRARNNLATIFLGTDPRKGLEMTRSGLELARRVGDRNMAHWLAESTAIIQYIMALDWDGAVALLDEELAGTRGAMERGRSFSIHTYIQAARGEDIDDRPTLIAEMLVGESEPWARAGLASNLGDIAFVKGDFTHAYDGFMRSIEEFTPFGFVVLPWAARAAIWSRDIDRARTVARRLDELADGSPSTEADRAYGHACLDALEGRTDAALAGFMDTTRRYRALELNWALARTCLDAVKVLPRVPEVMALADEARAIFSGLRAKPYLDLLDRELAPRPAEKTTTTVTA
jgi:class 3 adenylate cyclase/predicted ATPase